MHVDILLSLIRKLVMNKMFSPTTVPRSVIIVCLLILFIGLLFHIPHAFAHHYRHVPALPLLLLVIVAMPLHGLLSGRVSAPGVAKSDVSDTEKKEACPETVRRLMRHLDSKHPYLDEEFTLPALAGQLGMPVHVVSRAINVGLGMSYSELINQRRIAWAQQLLAKEENRDTKIIAIAWDAGFTSKSAFYSAFKKYTGLSPAAFRDKLAGQKRVRDHN